MLSGMLQRRWAKNKMTEFYPENIDRLDNITFNLTTPVKVTKWWQINLFTNVLQQ
jgi:hypothetical protein